MTQPLERLRLIVEDIMFALRAASQLNPPSALISSELWKNHICHAISEAHRYLSSGETSKGAVRALDAEALLHHTRKVIERGEFFVWHQNFDQSQSPVTALPGLKGDVTRVLDGALELVAHIKERAGVVDVAVKCAVEDRFKEALRSELDRLLGDLCFPLDMAIQHLSSLGQVAAQRRTLIVAALADCKDSCDKMLVSNSNDHKHLPEMYAMCLKAEELLEYVLEDVSRSELCTWRVAEQQFVGEKMFRTEVEPVRGISLQGVKHDVIVILKSCLTCLEGVKGRLRRIVGP